MIYEKLSKIQISVKAPKNLHNSFGNYNYRNAESIYEAVKPFLKSEKCSLTIADEIIQVESRFYVKATATLTDNEDGSSVSVSAFAREEETKRGMDGSQITGAASSYARKYALNGLFLLDDTKDADTDEYHEEAAKREEKARPKRTEHRKDTPAEAKKNEEVVASVDPVLLPTRDKVVTQEQWDRLYAEQERTGIDDHSLCAAMGVESIEKMTQAQVISAINKFARTPDKEKK